MTNGESGKSNETPKNPAVDEAIASAEEYLKGILRKEPLIPFHRDELFEPVGSDRFANAIGLQGASSNDVRSVAAKAIANLEARCPGLKINIRSYQNEEKLHGFDFRVHGATEWKDALSIAHGVDASEALRRLSEPAEQFLIRIESGEFCEFVKEVSIRRRIHFYGYGANFEALVRELRVKKGIEIETESKGERYHQQRHFLKFSVVARHPVGIDPVALNPTLPPAVVGQAVPKPFTQWLFRTIIDAPFEGTGRKNLWYFSTRAQFFRCFPHLKEKGKVTCDITQQLDLVRKQAPFDLGWNFDHFAPYWFVVVGPRGDWESTKTKLREELEKPTSEARFGLGPEAACLFDWVSGIDPQALEYCLTPIVEDAIRDKSLPLQQPWSPENLNVFISLLCEEITQSTPYDLKPMTWRRHSQEHVRIRVRKKPT